MRFFGFVFMHEGKLHKQLLAAKQEGRDEQRKLECALTHSLLRDSMAYQKIAEDLLGRRIKLKGSLLDKLIDDAAAGRKTKKLKMLLKKGAVPMKRLVELLEKVMVFVTPDLQQIIRDNIEAGKEWTRQKAEEVLDKLEDAAAQTTTSIDDSAVKMLREVLNLPDLPDETEPEKTDAE